MTQYMTPIFIDPIQKEYILKEIFHQIDKKGIGYIEFKQMERFLNSLYVYLKIKPANQKLI